MLPPTIISMPLPRMGSAIADLSFRIAVDGSVSNLKFLCLSNGAPLKEALETASRTWKFAPMKYLGKATASEARYRVSGSGAVPLNFLPERLRPIEG